MNEITLPNGEEIYYIDELTALDVYDEIYNENIYLKNGIQIEDGDIIFDVGANIGLFSKFISPMFFMVGTYQSGQQPIGSLRFWIDYCLGITMNTILMTWIYNNTNRSILSATLYHFMMNFTGEFLNLISLYHYYKVMWTTIIAILVVTLYKPKSFTDPPWENYLEK